MQSMHFSFLGDLIKGKLDRIWSTNTADLIGFWIDYDHARINCESCEIRPGLTRRVPQAWIADYSNTEIEFWLTGSLQMT